MHGPAFWMQALGLSGNAGPTDLLRQSLQLVRWETGLASSVVTDFSWFSNWALEIGSKQLKVLETLRARERL